MKSSRHQDRKLAAHATDAPSLSRRIEDMEQRLMVERAQAVAHAREFRGSVKRRLASPTSLLFAGSMGFVAAEFFSSRRGAKASGRGGSKAASKMKSAGKSLLGALTRPLLSMVQLGSVGFLVKQNKDATRSMQENATVGEPPPSLH